MMMNNLGVFARTKIVTGLNLQPHDVEQALNHCAKIRSRLNVLLAPDSTIIGHLHS